jgi:hypothetical protein
MTHDPRALATLSTVDYEQIEQAVMETARGRWFLKEYAARNRTADTRVLLEAMQRLEGALNGERSMEQVERVRNDLLDMAGSIESLRNELALGGEAGEPSRFGHATSALDAIVRTTEKATSDILGVAEQIQEIAWSLREQQHDSSVCDRIDRLATDIYTSCSFQDLTAQQTQKVVQTLRFLEGRINALIDAWSGDEPGSRPPASKDDSGEEEVLFTPAALDETGPSDVDFVIVEGEVAFDADAPIVLPEAGPRLGDDDIEMKLIDENAEEGEAPSDPPAVDSGLQADGIDRATQHDDDPLPIDGHSFEDELIEIDLDDDAPPVAEAAGQPETDSGFEPAPEPEVLASPPTAAQAPARSLAQIDAMTAAEKSLIFG